MRRRRGLPRLDAPPPTMAQKLDNYLRMYRRRAGLFQDEVAFLMGGESGTLVSRHERGARLPTLEMALAYEAALGVPARELFAGISQKVEQKVTKRARVLARKLSAAKTPLNRVNALDLLRRVSSGSASWPAQTS
ncbi:MAG: helix-turn-helix transcriptional regulator [Candidatus Rokubacteria bacterium]|nr:helix-turn-helix transcriptional regulator [Candidatus Rokubacteria bacterium]